MKTDKVIEELKGKEQTYFDPLKGTAHWKYYLKEDVLKAISELNAKHKETIKEIFDDIFKEFTVKEALILKETAMDGEVTLSEVAEKCMKLKSKHIKKEGG